MTIQGLLNHPNRWTQFEAARDSKGKACDPCADEAVSWSLDGAIKRCYGYLSDEVYVRVANKVMCFVSWFNDARYRTFEEIMEVVKELDI